MPLTAEDYSIVELPKVEWEFALSQREKPQRPTRYVRTEDELVTPVAIREGRLRLASAGIKYLSAIIGNLIELREEEDCDDFGVLRATEHAFESAVQLLTDAAIEAASERRQIPYGCASTDSEGGVRIEWIRENASVHAVIPASPNRKAYIYHEAGSRHGTEPATPQNLARRLRSVD